MATATTASVAKATTTTTTEVKKISKVMVTKAHRLADLRALIREAEAEAEALRTEILAEAGTATTLVHHGLDVVTITARSTERVDSKKLRTEFPEVYGLVTKQTTSRVVDILPR
jgi:predicted phage-related endonuclease